MTNQQHTTINQAAEAVITTASIPDENYTQFVDQFNALCKRAARLHMPAPVLTEMGLATESRRNPCYDRALARQEDTSGAYAEVYATIDVIVHHITVTGYAPCLPGGWHFIATIEHVEDGGGYSNIVRSIPEQTSEGELADYRTSAPTCDHCQLARRRNDTYIVRNSDGVTRRVGKSCLRDFLGHTSPETLVAQFEALADMQAMVHASEAYGEGESAGRVTVLNTQVYLAYVSAAMRTAGWVSKSAARESYDQKIATATVAERAIDEARRSPSRQDRLHTSDGDYDRADRALAWIHELVITVATSDYLYNLSVACRAEYCSYRHTGIVASLIAAYERETGRQLERQASAAASKHQGIVGKPLALRVTVLSMRDYTGAYGVTFIYKLRDTAGNVYTWFASSECMKQGRQYTLTATVKKHELYNGEAQTVITRGRNVIDSTL